MPHTYHMTRISGNKKTGPIPVTTTSKSTCPTLCPFSSNGCYPERGPLALHWRAVSAGTRGGTLAELCAQIKRLPKRQLWRWAQAGDLPGDGRLIDFDALDQLVAANAGRCGFGYTHYDPFIPGNAAAIRYANERGFILNLSADNLVHADQLAALGIAPVATVLPIEWESERTPEGRHVAECPANVRDDMTCANCGICAVAGHKSIIGFRAHGSGAKKAQAVFFMKRVPIETVRKELPVAEEIA